MKWNCNLQEINYPKQKLRRRQVGDGMGGGGNGCFGGRPDFAYVCGKCRILQDFGQNRGPPEAAVPTTTHPIPHLTPSEKRRI